MSLSFSVFSQLALHFFYLPLRIISRTTSENKIQNQTKTKGTSKGKKQKLVKRSTLPFKQQFISITEVESRGVGHGQVCGVEPRGWREVETSVEVNPGGRGALGGTFTGGCGGAEGYPLPRTRLGLSCLSWRARCWYCIVV